MARTLVRDRKGVLEGYAGEAIKKYKDFRALSQIKILWLWRVGESPKYDDEGRQVAAQTRVLPKRERDIYGYDVEIEVFKASWKRRSEKAKRRLIYHELLHIDIEQGENFKVNKDDDGRIIVKARAHDVVITSFEREIKKYGLSGGDVPDAAIVAKALKEQRKKRKKGQKK